MTDKEGQEAKAFVEEQLKKVEFIIVKTYKDDKYGRYLADVFYKAKEENAKTVLEDGIFLNQELLNLGLAKKMAWLGRDMKVLHIISSGGLFGAENVVLSLAREHTKQGMKACVGVICNEYNPHLELIEEAERHGIKTETILLPQAI